jgi:glucose/arabinose dehydrogenase
VFVGSAHADKVHAIIDDDGRRRVKVFVAGLHRPNGLAYHDDTLYIVDVSKISKIDDVEKTLNDPPKLKVTYDGLPKNETHGARFIAVGPDGKLYIAVGQLCNNCVPSGGSGEIRRIDVNGGNIEVAARGVRNSVGFDWSPRNKQLYFTDNGRDWL